MTVEQIIVCIVILFLIISLYKSLFGAGFTFIIGISILGISGILTPSEMMNGFANEQIAVIIMLLLIGDVIRKSSLIDSLFNRFFKKTFSYKRFLIKLMFPVAGLSALINNTPLVAILMPYVHNWGKKNNIAPSKLLIPLSFAAILGGTATLIGTSTNLVVNGMVSDQTLIPGFTSLEIFDFTPVGLSMIIIGGFYLAFFGKALLPDKSDVIDKLSKKTREYIVEVQVRKESDLHNKTIKDAKLRNLKGLFLVEIIRGDKTITPVTPQTIIYEEDLLIFTGNPDTIADMVESNDSLQPSQLGMFAKRAKTEMKELVLSPNSNLISKTVKESNFRSKYDASVLAIHRNGERISGKIGNVKLIAGDLLLVITGKDFSKITTDSKNFYLLNNIRSIKKLPTLQTLLIVGGLIISVVLSSIKLVPLFTSLLVFIIVLLLSKISSPKEIVKGINYDLIFIIALSMALGAAMTKTNIAYNISHLLLELIQPYGIFTLCIGIFIITNLLAAIITNIGAVALIFPISLNLADQLSLDPKPFVLLIAYAAAASFITPIGYQTNLMVYGPGGYNFKDFFKIGFPLSILFMLVAVIGLILQFGLQIN